MSDDNNTLSQKVIKTVVVGGSTLIIASAGYLGFVNEREGTDRKVYADMLAQGIPTACGGVTKHTSPYPVIVGEVWSQERCDEVLSKVTGNNQIKLATCFKSKNKVSQNAFDALSSHAHNFGVGNTCASRALVLIDQGRLAEGCQAISRGPDNEPVWSFVNTGKRDANGKFIMKYVPGLQNRRLLETELCLTPDKQK